MPLTLTPHTLGQFTFPPTPGDIGDIPVWDGSGWDFRSSAGDARYVAPVADGGDDSASGGNNLAPLATIDAAVAALPDGGAIFCRPGEFSPTTTLRNSGHHIIGAGCGLDGSNEVSVIQHAFNGPLIEFYRGGGGLSGFNLNNNDTGATSYTGAAIYALADGVNQAPGRVFIRDIVASGGTNGWERVVQVDGALSANGCRQWFFDNCLFFGGNHAGAVSETIFITKAIHWHFKSVDLNDGAGTAGIKIRDGATEDVYFTGCKNSGPFDSTAAASGSASKKLSVFFSGRQIGAITCGASSAGHFFVGQVHEAAFTNSGTTRGHSANRRIGPYARTELTHTVNQSINSASTTAITFDTETVDDDSWHAAGNPTRITVLEAGDYRITGSVRWAAHATGRRVLQIRKNGTATLAGQSTQAITDAGVDTAQNVSRVCVLAASDYVELVVTQASGGALNVLGALTESPVFTVERIS